MNFFERQFDKIMAAVFLLIIMSICVWFAFKLPGDQFKWAIGAFGLFFGLWSGLITGYYMGKNSSQPPTAPAPAVIAQPAPTPAPTPTPSPATIETLAQAQPFQPVQVQVAPPAAR